MFKFKKKKKESEKKQFNSIQEVMDDLMEYQAKHTISKEEIDRIIPDDHWERAALCHKRAKEGNFKLLSEMFKTTPEYEKELFNYYGKDNLWKIKKIYRMTIRYLKAERSFSKSMLGVSKHYGESNRSLKNRMPYEWQTAHLSDSDIHKIVKDNEKKLSDLYYRGYTLVDFSKCFREKLQWEDKFKTTYYW